MFRKLYSSTSNTIQGAAILLTFSSILAQIFGLIRDKLLASMIGPNTVLDVYYSAFRIPDIIFSVVATLFSATILLPFFAKYITNSDQEGAQRFIRDCMISFGVLMLVVCGIAYFAFPLLSKGLIAGFSYEMQNTYVKIGRILLLSPILLGASNLLSTVTQHYKHIIVWSLAPLLYNFGIIIGTLFYRQFGINSVVLGVVFGALMHLLIQVPVFINLKFGFKFVSRFNLKEVLGVLKTAFPRTLSLSLGNLVMLVLIAVASTMSVGSVSLFTFAYTVQAVPLTLIGLSFSVAAFPVMSKLYAESNIDDFKKEFRKVSRNILMLTTVTAVVFIFFRTQLISLLLGSGEFNSYHTLRTSWLIFIACFGMVPAGLVQLYLRSLYAMGKTKKPFIATFLTAIFTVFVTIYTLHLMKNTYLPEFLSNFTGLNKDDTFVLSLMLAIVLSSVVNVFLLKSIINRYINFKNIFILKDITKTLFVSVFSTLISFIFYKTITFFDDNVLFGHFVFVLSLMLNTVLVYKMAKRYKINEIYEYLDFYKNKLVSIVKSW